MYTDLYNQNLEALIFPHFFANIVMRLGEQTQVKLNLGIIHNLTHNVNLEFNLFAVLMLCYVYGSLFFYFS